MAPVELDPYTIPEYYDEFQSGVEGDVLFYATEARRTQGPVLELGAGTARILIPMAAVGCRVTGLERHPNMLARAKTKLARLPDRTRKRIKMLQGDMRDFNLKQKFKLVVIPYRAFQHNLTVEDQKRCLRCIHDHLDPGGRLALNVFDPSYQILLAGEAPLGHPTIRYGEFQHPKSGNRVIVWIARRSSDFATQVLTEDWIFEEINEDGRVVARDIRTLSLRYFFRYEMQHLLEGAGFKIEALYGDFRRGPFRHAGEQIWTAQRMD